MQRVVLCPPRSPQVVVKIVVYRDVSSIGYLVACWCLSMPSKSIEAEHKLLALGTGEEESTETKSSIPFHTKGGIDTLCENSATLCNVARVAKILHIFV